MNSTTEIISRLRERALDGETAAVAVANGLSFDELLAGDGAIARAARRQLWLHVRRTRRWSYAEIGREFGRSATAILHGVRKAEQERRAS